MLSNLKTYTHFHYEQNLHLNLKKGFIMSDMTEVEHKKELAKLKRLAIEIASEIHDIVEDTVWTNHVKMPELAEKLYVAVEKANAYKAEHSL